MEEHLVIDIVCIGNEWNLITQFCESIRWRTSYYNI